MKIKRYLSTFLAAVMLTGIALTSSPAGAATRPATDFQRVANGNLEIIDPSSTLTEFDDQGKVRPRVFVTIFRATKCPKYVFFGVRGSEEGYAYKSNHQIGSIKGKNGSLDIIKYDDNPIAKDSLKNSDGTLKDSYGIGLTLGRIFTNLKKQDRFKNKIASAAPWNKHAYDYQAPGVTSALGGAGEARNYVASMYQNGVSASISALYFLAKACPSSKVIAAGYSQGAFIVSATVKTINDNQKYETAKTILPTLKAAVVLADPAEPDTGLIAQIRKIRTNAIYANLTDFVAEINKQLGAEGKVGTTFGSILEIFRLGKNLSEKVGATGLTAYANINTARPKSGPVPIKGYTKDGDLIGRTTLVFDDVIKKVKVNSVWCVVSKSACAAALTASVAKFSEATSVHTSYASDDWASKWFVYYLNSLPGLK